MTAPTGRPVGGKRPGAGRKKIELTDAQISEVKRLSQLHCSELEIAVYLGVCERTFRTLKRRDKRVPEAMENGKSEGRVSLRRAQFRAALGGNVRMLIYLGEVILHQRAGFDGDDLELEAERAVPKKTVIDGLNEAFDETY